MKIKKGSSNLILPVVLLLIAAILAGNINGEITGNQLIRPSQISPGSCGNIAGVDTFTYANAPRDTFPFTVQGIITESDMPNALKSSNVWDSVMFQEIFINGKFVVGESEGYFDNEWGNWYMVPETDGSGSGDSDLVEYRLKFSNPVKLRPGTELYILGKPYTVTRVYSAGDTWILNSCTDDQGESTRLKLKDGAPINLNHDFIWSSDVTISSNPSGEVSEIVLSLSADPIAGVEIDLPPIGAFDYGPDRLSEMQENPPVLLGLDATANEQFVFQNLVFSLIYTLPYF